MATQDDQPDGLEFRDRTETLLERTTDKFDQMTSRHLPSLFDCPGVSVDNQTGDKPDGVTPCPGDSLPTIAEETIDADDSDTDTDEPPKPVTVHVADSPEPAPNQHVFDQTNHEGPAPAAEYTQSPASFAHPRPSRGPAYTIDDAGR